MNMNDDTLSNLVNQLVNGTIDHDGLERLNAYAHANRDNLSHLQHERERALLMAMADCEADIDVEAAIERFRRHIAKTPTSTRHRAIRIWRYVATLLLLLLPAVGFYLGNRHTEEQFADITAEAPYGSQLNLELPDGTQVRLNSGSRLIYSQGFGITDRHVRLLGEAWFRIHHDADKPFLLRTPSITVEDLGTEFNVRDYAEDTKAEVSLVDGSLSVGAIMKNVKNVIMKAGERLTYDKQSGMMTKVSLQLDASEAKDMSSLSFIDQRVDVIAQQLSRAYGVKITVTPAAAGKRLYGFFNKKEDSIDEVLTVMSRTGTIKYRHEKGRYVIY